MNGIIILDGPDACGKSTLQEAIVNTYGAIAMHLTYPAPAPYKDMWDYMVQRMQEAIEYSQHDLVVVDRHWISEKIYASVFRGGSPWPMMGRMMDRVWQKHAAMYIMCLPDNIDAAIERHNENLDPKHPYKDADYRKLLFEYKTFTANFMAGGRQDVKIYRIEVEGQDMTAFVDDLVDDLQCHREQQYYAALNPSESNLLGHRNNARFLFIGDMVNQKNNTFAWPFFEHRNCSLFLTNVLDQIGFDESHAMWTNTRDQYGRMSPHIVELPEWYNLTLVVFGRKAEQIVKQYGTSGYIYLIHPQYAHRFPHARERFVNELTIALGRY